MAKKQKNPFETFDECNSLTESSKMFEVLKSRYITLTSSLWRNSKPFAAPRAIFMRSFHERV